MTTLIEVTIGKPTEIGRLWPKYDVEADLLEIMNRATPEWPLGLDIDGNIIFDLDAGRRIANIDLLVRRSLWEVKPTFAMPRPTHTGDLYVTPRSVTIKSFNIPIRLFTNPTRSMVYCAIGTQPAGNTVVELSTRCVALLTRGRLTGFCADLR